MTRSVPQLPSDANGSSSVRDFIYLDEAKVFSYLAQMEGGLRLLRQRVESALDINSEESGGDKTAGQHNVEGGLSPTVAAVLGALGVAGGALPMGLLAGLTGKYTYQRNWENTTPNLKTSTNDGASSSDLTILHHAAFELVMQRMGSKFISVTGHASLLTLGMINGILDIIVDEPEERIKMQNSFGLLKTMDVQNICFVEGEENVHGFMRDEHFLVPPTNFVGSYGSPTEIQFTLVGIYAQRPGRAGRRTHPQQAEIPESQGVFKGVNESFSIVSRTLGINGARRIYPIAMYREL